MTRYERDEVGDTLRETRTDQGIASLYEGQEERVAVAVMHALHRFGLPGWRMESTFRDLCRAWCLPGQLLAMPTALHFAFGEGVHQRTLLMRVEPSGIDLGRLAELDELTTEITTWRIGPEQALERLGTILQASRRWPWPVDLLAGAVASGSAAALFVGAGLEDMAVSALAGVFVAALALGSERTAALSQSWVMLSALVSTLVAGFTASLWPAVHAGVVSVAGIILLVPGLSFTITMIELATQNLSSAVARFAAVVLTLVQLALGVAFARAIIPPSPETATDDLPTWALAAAIVLLPPAIGVLMGGRGRDLPIMVATSIIGWGAARIATDPLGPVAGAMVGTFALGLTSNLYARWTRRPALVPMVTGLFLLVPGSLGFRGMEAMLSGQTLQGIEALFRMGMGAFALAAGLVLATTVLDPRSSP